MEDVTPILLSRIEKDFEAAFSRNKKIAALYERIRDGTATYREANQFAIEAGELLAAVFRRHLNGNALPDGRMYYNIANRIIPAALRHNYELISDVAARVQESLNRNAGIGIKAIRPGFNTDRIEGIVNKISSAEKFEEVAWVLEEPVVNFSQSVVDDYIRENAEFHASSGMQPRIVRTAVGACCEWCGKLAGTYAYPNIPHDIYRRHERCRCTVDYDPGTGKGRQNVHTKQWRNQTKIEARKKVGANQGNREPPESREARVNQMIRARAEKRNTIRP